jgi:hypothetical protein
VVADYAGASLNKAKTVQYQILTKGLQRGLFLTSALQKALVVLLIWAIRGSFGK